MVADLLAKAVARPGSGYASHFCSGAVWEWVGPDPAAPLAPEHARKMGKVYNSSVCIGCITCTVSNTG